MFRIKSRKTGIKFRVRRRIPKMDLLQLPQHLLERIATKFEWRSYFRMQQTCHDMAELFRTSRVNVYMPDNYPLSITGGKDDLPQFYFHRHFGESLKLDDTIDILYGARFTYIKIDDVYFQTICDILKKYRITCEVLYLDDAKKSSSHYVQEEFEEMLKLLKPVEVKADSRRSNMHEVLLKGKYLKEAKITLLREDMPDLTIMKQFMSKFHTLHINMRAEDNNSCIHVANTILHYLRSESHPELRLLKFSGQHRGTWRPLAAEEIKSHFPDFNMILWHIREEQNNLIFCGFVLKLRPGGDYVCRLEFDQHAKIRLEYNSRGVT